MTTKAKTDRSDETGDEGSRDEDGDGGKAAPLPPARVHRDGDAEGAAAAEPGMLGLPRWVWLAGAGALLAVGLLVILMANGFHVTPPVVFVCLGYLAGVSAVYALFRTGASAVSAEDEGADHASWGRPVGARAELEREKRALLKAIKEAEFDLQMGKLSKSDAETMIASFRAQAIAVIREIDRKDGVAATARDEIEREVRARLEVARTKKTTDGEKRPAGKKADKDKGKRGGATAKKDAKAAKVEEAVEAKEAEEAKDAEAKDAEAKDAEAKDAEAKPEEKGDDRITDAAPSAAPPVTEAAEVVAGNASGEETAKEATP
jgi:hypothetical protein